jgi:hypothetical protein
MQLTIWQLLSDRSQNMFATPAKQQRQRTQATSMGAAIDTIGPARHFMWSPGEIAAMIPIERKNLRQTAIAQTGPTLKQLQPEQIVFVGNYRET